MRQVQFTVRVETSEGHAASFRTAVGGKWLDKSLDDGLITPALEECYKRNRSLPKVVAQQCSITVGFTCVDGRRKISSHGWAGEVDLVLSFPDVRAGSYVPPVVPLPAFTSVACI